MSFPSSITSCVAEGTPDRIHVVMQTSYAIVVSIFYLYICVSSRFILLRFVNQLQVPVLFCFTTLFTIKIKKNLLYCQLQFDFKTM